MGASSVGQVAAVWSYSKAAQELARQSDMMKPGPRFWSSFLVQRRQRAMDLGTQARG